MKKLWRKFLCMIGDHDWTSKAMQGIKPNEEEVTTGMSGYYKYAKMYCGWCGKESKFNK